MVKTVAFLLRRIDCNDGVASHCATLIEGLRAHGLDVILMTGPVTWDERTRPRFDQLRSAASRWVDLSLPTSTRPSWKAAREVAAALKQARADVLHVHGLSCLPLARLATLQLRRAPAIVVTAHPSGSSSPDPSRVVRRWLHALNPLAIRIGWPWPAAFVAVSSEMHQWFTETLSIPSDHVHRIVNGVDDAHFRPPTAAERSAARAAFGLGDDDFVCTLVGRMEPVKRHDLLLRALARLNHPTRPIHALLVGDGQHRDAIRQLATELGLLSRVQFCGFPPDVRPAYWAADAVVLPSDREAFGLTIAEGMLCGAVPIRTATGGASDQIDDGVSGFILRDPVDASLTEALATLRDDTAGARAMSAAAINRAGQMFTKEIMVRQTLTIYNAVAGHVSAR